MGSLPPLLSSKPAASQRRGGTRVTLIRDAETESLVNGFAFPLFRVAGVSPGLIRISLVRDRALNAFVTTGNRMFLNTGLIQQAASALEVIGAMAHETGHVAHGDISRLPEQALQALIESLGSMLIGAAAAVASRSPDVGAGMVLGGQSMAQRRFMAFTRGQEIVADQSALNYLDRLSWSARGMLALFERLEQEEALVIDRRDPYVVTHPFSRDRLIRVQEHVARTGGRSTGATDGFEQPFRMVKAKLDAFLEAPGYVARTYQAADPAPEMRYANAVLNHRMGHRDTAVSILDGLIRQFPASPWLHELKGQVLLEGGQARAAVAPYQTAVRLAPDQPLLRQGYGHALLETGDAAMTRQAVTQLQMAQGGVQGRERGDPTTWRLLGIAWGRLGNVGEANLALAEEAMLNNDIPVARRFARQAADALPAGPSRLRALDITNASKKENRS